MNIKEWIAPISFAIIMTYGIQYFFEPKIEKNIAQQYVKSGEGFVAPTLQDINKPLQLEVDFSSLDKDKSTQLYTVTTLSGTYVFSNRGAVLQAFSFPWQKGKETINTILADENCFLLALENNTPLFYTLGKVSGDETSDRTVEYAANFQGGVITKRFTLHQDSYQVDLDIAVDYNDAENTTPLQLRLFFAEPAMQPEIQWDKKAGIINTDTSISAIDLTKKDNFQRYWALPTCFGYESRFIIHALIKDENSFAQRVYMKKNQAGNVSGVLESRTFDQSGHWKVSFFMGPKTAEAITQVDARLLKTMNFGWFAPISHPILSFLKYLYEKMGNYGWAIILLTLLLKLLLLPFTLYGEKNMRKGVDMQKKMTYLQQKYKNDPEMLEQQRAELIKKHGVPGLAGCLPMLLTIPVLIALNTVLSNAVELYGASFLWIKNLYEVDPYYVLPILTGFAMLATPMDNDPKKGLMRYAMALMMATITCYLSAGLVLFILVNSLVAAVQTRLQKR